MLPRNDATKTLTHGAASALTVALGLGLIAQPALAQEAAPAPSASAPAPSASQTPGDVPGESVEPIPAASATASAPGDQGNNPVEEQPAPAPMVTKFKDVPQTHQFYREISWLGEMGISTGWSDGTYRPSEKIERAAIAAYFYRMADSPEVQLPKESPFSDVKEGDPFYKEIVWMHQAGITTGWSDGTFRPHEPVSREALAAFFYRAADGNEQVPAQAPFKDVDSGNQFYREITWFKNQKITTGWPDGTFRPHEAVTREATAAFVYRFATV